MLTSVLVFPAQDNVIAYCASDARVKQEFAQIRDSGEYTLDELVERADKSNIVPGEKAYIIESFITVFSKPYSPTQWWDTTYRSCVRNATEIVVEQPPS